ncbi:MAG: hypothetical protein ACI4XJ_05620 [Eubacteriales bacterium]
MKNLFNIFVKIIWYFFLFELFLAAHVTILVVTHCAVISIETGISLDAAVIPLHNYITTCDYIGAYFLMRETVFESIPYFNLFDGLLVGQYTPDFYALFYDTVQAALGGVLAYLLCRLNYFLSSAKHPILFSCITSVWTSLSLFSALIIITCIRTLYSAWSVPICIALLAASALISTLLSFFGIRRAGVPISFKRTMGSYLGGYLTGIVDSVFAFLMSCLSFDILRRYITDGATLMFVMILTAAFFTLVYNTAKSKWLK